MTDKTPIDAVLRSRVADLLHLLQFARIETPAAGDAEEAEKAMNDLERMLAAPVEAPAVAGQVEWIAMEEQRPPIGVAVLACGVGKEFGGVHVNQLEKGSTLGGGYDPELYYWAGGEEFDEVTHWAPLPAMPRAAEQPDTVRVPHITLMEAQSIIESYAEALKASHAPGGDWGEDEAAQEDYVYESRVAAELRALLRKEGDA